MEELLIKGIPFIIPAILIGSWLVNHKTGIGGGKSKGSEGGSSSAGSAGSSKASSKPAEQSKLSDKDMTG